MDIPLEFPLFPFTLSVKPSKHAVGHYLSTEIRKSIINKAKQFHSLYAINIKINYSK